MVRRRSGMQGYFTASDIFRHVSPDADAAPAPLLQGTWRVYRHMYHIVRVAQ